MTVCIGVLGGGFASTQESGETNNPPSAIADETKKAEPGQLISSREILSSIEESGLDFNQAIHSEAPLVSLSITTNDIVEKVVTNDLTRIELQRVEITGTVTPVVKKRTFGSFLQLFNPFAPAEYGGTTEPVGKAPSRAFMDPVTSQPTSPLIGVGGKPKQPEK